ncbi:carboxypeptidase-like regulatory domain-containing protein [Gilvimarinus sp. DA14]|uniref:carboxypeptidase-like regulatory domain-containing protein n=1 Tax=Gilvimarinus sp. DA14 TaxID=2956798 RepID=UPI0020B7E19E|nr:carboxypeptidase-like regulatory domain-containing protein [Gilvimarinus sp. DA14]UTF60530.1 hypothetical protein NHM04_01665 [Gilvimarinus sp. DA14]
MLYSLCPARVRQALAMIALLSLLGCGGAGSGDGSSSSQSSIVSSSSSSVTFSASSSSLPSSTSSSVSSSSVQSSAISSSSSTPGQTTVNLSGTLSYDFVPLTARGLDYSATEQRPIRGAIVNVLSASGDVISSGVSDAEGGYHFALAPRQQVQLEVEARARQTGQQRWHLRVEDNTAANAIYVLQGSLASVGDEDSVRDLHAPSGWTGAAYGAPRAAAPFAILDTAWDILQQLIAQDPELALPVARFRWSPANKPSAGEIADGDIGTSYYDGEALYILGAENSDTDEYDRHIIAHEWAHFFEDAIGQRLDSIGGPHAQDDKLDLRVSYSEGLANALAGYTLNDPVYLDSLGAGQQQVAGFDIGSSSGADGGWYSEESLQQVFYQWMSEVGLGPLYQTLESSGYQDNDAFASVFSFAEELSIAAPASAERFNALARAHNINSAQSFAPGESNDGNTSNALPVYHTLTDGQTINVCSSQENGVAGAGFAQNFNKLGYSSFIRFTPPVSAVYQITLITSSSPISETDPDFEVYWRGDFIGSGFSSAVDSEQQTLELFANREYIFAVYDYAAHPDIGSFFYQPSCIDVSVNAVGEL